MALSGSFFDLKRMLQYYKSFSIGSLLNMKPDRNTAMQQLIDQVKQNFPLDNPELAVCGPNNTCIGCPKKLLEIVDSEVAY